MKKLSKVLVLVLSAIMILAMSVSVFAAEEIDSGKNGPASITITLPTEEEAPTTAVKYTVYKVFDATNDGSSSAIAYKIDSANGNLTAAMTAAGFSVDTAGNVSGPAGTQLNDAAIAAIAAYAKDKIGEFTAPAGAGTLKITGLEYGYYYITTTTGSVVTVDSTNPNATVNDKNTVPVVDKSITGVGDGSYDQAGQNAIAQVGTKVTYTGTITVGNGAQNYVYHDKMESVLLFDSTSVVVKAGSTTMTAGTDYTLVTSPSDDCTFEVKFEDASVSKLEAGSTITIEYKATVTSDALTTDPANNTAYISYGDGGKSTSDSTNVYNAKFTVTKQDGDNKPLPGAGFVIKNAAGKYYKIENNVVSWVNNEADATEYTSDANGAVTPFTGLADGTYTLHEKTVPAGYNAAADSTFTIAAGDYTAGNLEQEATVTNNAGTELPATGGIGTTIFYVLGSLLVIGCGIVLVSRKRMQNNK